MKGCVERKVSWLRILVSILNIIFPSLPDSVLTAMESALENRKASGEGGDKPPPLR